MSSLRSWTSIVLFVLLLPSCRTEYPESCATGAPVGLASADEIAGDDSLPFRFPLDGPLTDTDLVQGWFGASNACTPDIEDCYEFPERAYHAAEDFLYPAGTPVYAMADGTISFSGREGGYGWLILVDHPQLNLYSLYGHLSPSRWKQEAGTDVERGDLIGYLGDSHENGGNREYPLVTHLHFGVRAGQIADYPAKGAWRYMAGWIGLCPQDLGWLQPSVVITTQEVPVDGYPQPEVGFLIRFGLDLIFAGLFVIGAAIFWVTNRKGPRFLLLVPGFVVLVACFILPNRGLLSSNVALVIGILIFAVGIFLFIRRPVPTSQVR